MRFIVTPWNYPYRTSVNGVIPALMAGNAVALATCIKDVRQWHKADMTRLVI